MALLPAPFAQGEGVAERPCLSPPRRPRADAARRQRGLAPPLALAAAALAAAYAPACGGEERAPRGPANASQFLAQYELSLCGVVTSCCSSRGLVLDPTVCPNEVRQAFPETLLDEAKYAYDRDGAAVCLDTLRSLPDACAPFAAGAFGAGSDFERACGRAFLSRGASPPGAPCAAAWQCAAPAEPNALSACTLSNGPSGNYQRTCEVRAYAGATEPCDTGATPRQDARAGVTRACRPEGLYCAGDGTCQASATAAGQPCEAGAADACIGGTFCNGQSLCEAPRAAGSPCDDTPDACDGASFCDLTSKLCTPRRAEGQPCSTEAECWGACAGGACSAPLPDRRDDYSNLCAGAFSAAQSLGPARP